MCEGFAFIPALKNGVFSLCPLRSPEIKRIVDTRQLNAKESIDLVRNIGDTWVIKLQPYGMCWHCKLKKFVVYTDPEDFNKYCIFCEGDAFDYFYGCDVLQMNNNTVNCEKIKEAGII
ncbi:MAG: hypothetical protein QUS12_07930 [Methanosarcina sp.]|nr:hypothetical protein [Methanosarcina sp.]